jgi:putative membrane protein
MAAREWAAVYLKGAAMGAADAVPGVSGGTIALITGIYERLVGAIAALDPEDAVALLPLLPRLGSRNAREELRGSLTDMEVPFLLVLGVGVLTAVITVANAVDVAYHQYPGLTFAFFFGLIAASVVVLLGEVSRRRDGWRLASRGSRSRSSSAGSRRGTCCRAGWPCCSSRGRSPSARWCCPASRGRSSC